MKLVPAALTLACSVLLAQSPSPDPLREARAAIERDDAAGARKLLVETRQQALQARDDALALSAVRILAYLARVDGDYKTTEDWLSEAPDYTGRLRGYNDGEVADLRVEVAAVRRLQRNFEGALASLQEALSSTMLTTTGDSVRSARIATFLAQVGLDPRKPRARNFSSADRSQEVE